MKHFQLETRNYQYIVPSDDPCGYYMTPVMGWMMDDNDVRLTAIIEDGVFADSVHHAIVLPSGIVHTYRGAEFDSIQEWLRR